MQLLMGKVHENSTKRIFLVGRETPKDAQNSKALKETVAAALYLQILSISSSAMLGMKVKKEDSETFKLFLSFS